MDFVSICAGIEAASVAWHPLGWRARAYAEIAPFPSAVLAHRFPGVPNLGDFTKIEPDDLDGPIDLLAAGTPCQDFSVAGLRAGLTGDRGQLTIEFVRLLERFRPEWFVFENVPGILSADRGRAFGLFLSLLAKCGYGFAYRLLDAQYFGVPQRRRRLFVVGYLGDWRPPAAVLFERESLRGDPPPRRGERQRIAKTVTGGTYGSSGYRGAHHDLDLVPVVSHALNAGAAARHDAFSETLIPLLEPGGRTGKSTTDIRCGDGTGQNGDPMFTLQAGHPHGIAIPINPNALRGDGRAKTPSADAEGRIRLRDPSLGVGDAGDPADTVTAASPGMVATAFSCKDYGQDASRDVAPTLRAMNEVNGNANGGEQLAVAFNWDQWHSEFAPSDQSPALRGSTHNAPAVSFQTRVARNGRGVEADLVPALTGVDAGNTSDMRPCVAFKPSHYTRCKDGAPSETHGPLATEADKGDQESILLTGAQVRRLTPREYERLQGFPDDWTLVPYRGRPAADSPRYKACGNSQAVPVMHWIGRRIELVRALQGKKP